MAILSCQELAELIGGSAAEIRVYKGRGKIIANDDNYYDTEHPLNQIFIKQQRVKRRRKAEFNFIEEKGAKIDWNDEQDVKENKKRIFEQSDAEDDILTKLQKQKEQLAIEKLQEDIKLARSKNDKISGETIPTELVVSAFSQFGKSTVTSFSNASDAILLKVSSIKQLTREEYAMLKGEFKKAINEAASEAVKHAKAQIDNIVSEYSETRGRGERT